MSDPPLVGHRVIRGALRMQPEEIDARHHEIPRVRDVIVDCNCPNEVTSARVALRLRRRGFERVHPLLGGIHGWRERELPLSIGA